MLVIGVGIGFCHPGSDYAAITSDQYLPTLSTISQHEYQVFFSLTDFALFLMF